MKRSKLRCNVLILAAALLASSSLIGAEYKVSSQEDYRKAEKAAQPGDVIVLANGVWRDFEILFRGEGTAEQPITLTAEEKGKVILSGQSNLRLAGKHLVVSGLVFRDGYTPTSEVISFRQNKENFAYHSRVTETVIDHYNNPERTEPDFWVIMYGRHNRFDHNHLVGKMNRGVTMAVRLNTEASQENHHRIDHNYFGPRPELGSNGGETLRIGTSHYSLTNSFSVVENNYFDRCNGEVEIISNKSGGNVFRGNLFFESRGTMTLRHGNDNVVENNVFFGNGVDHTGGIRVINKRQTVRNNYMEGLRGYRFGSALTVMNGVPDSPINRYHQVEDSLIERNSVIESAHLELGAGSDDERSAVPISTRFSANLISNSDGENIFRVNDDMSGIEFSDNALNAVRDPAIEKGFRNQSFELERAANGLLYPTDTELRNTGVSRDLQPLDRDATGVDWYPKAGKAVEFDSGQVHALKPGDSLYDALLNSGPGDVMSLAPGLRYLMDAFQALHFSK